MFVFAGLVGLSDQKRAMSQFCCDAVSPRASDKEASLTIISLVYIPLDEQLFSLRFL